MRIVDAAFSVVDGKQNANSEMATRSRDERERKTRDEISGAGLRARIFGRCGEEGGGRGGGGRRTDVGKVHQPEQLFPGEISLSAGLVLARDIQRNIGQKEEGREGEKMNETRRLMARRVKAREKSSGDSAAR